jgi:hypothetical protein
MVLGAAAFIPSLVVLLIAPGRRRQVADRRPYPRRLRG